MKEEICKHLGAMRYNETRGLDFDVEQEGDVSKREHQSRKKKAPMFKSKVVGVK